VHRRALRMLGKFAIGWIALTLLGGMILRGGLSLRMSGILLRDSRGRRAGPLRAALRSLVAWSPLGIWIAPLFLPPASAPIAWTLVAAAPVLFLLGGAYAIWRPARGLPDVVAGTWLAPR
jgi:hypothetical protein